MRERAKYCRAGQATHDNITRHIRIAGCIPNSTNTQSEYVIHGVQLKIGPLTKP